MQEEVLRMQEEVLRMQEEELRILEAGSQQALQNDKCNFNLN
jgi:hypothetical protein